MGNGRCDRSRTGPDQDPLLWVIGRGSRTPWAQGLRPYSFSEAQVMIESWQRHYETVPARLARLSRVGTGGDRAGTRRTDDGATSAGLTNDLGRDPKTSHAPRTTRRGPANKGIHR